MQAQNTIKTRAKRTAAHQEKLKAKAAAGKEILEKDEEMEDQLLRSLLAACLENADPPGIDPELGSEYDSESAR